MSNNRRQFIKGGLLGGAAIASGALAESSRAAMQRRESGPLSVLILGGTGFIGPHMVREALRRGHAVTLFNRGRSNSDLFPDLETIVGDRGGDLAGLKGRRWDVVVDNSGYVPRHVANSTAALAGNIGHYLFISTISTYASYAEPGDEDSPLATMADESVEEVTGATYGPLKVLCEQRARAAIAADRLTILRPTYICGPGDHTDRFSYWPVRVSRGGEMLLPGDTAHALQIIDVRDLANFTIDCVEQGIAGIYNTVTPVGSYTMGQLLVDSQAVTAASVQPLWVSEAFAAEAQSNSSAANWGMFPIWHPRSGDNAAVARISGARARAAGLHNRPVRETIRDLLEWWQTLPAERTTTMQAGMTAAQEAELIALWKKQNA